MAILEIKKYPESVLGKRAEEVKEITPEIKKLIEDMVETMLKAEPEGVGLAAPQIGVSKKIFIAQTEKGPAVFINPKITKKSRETDVLEEGCLSLPGVWLKVERAKKVELNGLDITGKKIKTKAEGIFARIFQHEMDHLDGVLIRDKEAL
ncbi:MAG: peptide deformylase [Candidatus Nealsonbacteria bacterium]|nr:peptide deformylase [Candidatus Nealsonbacteria bacterium]